LALFWASTEPSHVFGQQHASCSIRHSRVVHIPHRYAISSQGESPFSKRAVQFIQKAAENARPRSARGPERSPRQVRESIKSTIVALLIYLRCLVCHRPSHQAMRRADLARPIPLPRRNLCQSLAHDLHHHLGKIGRLIKISFATSRHGMKRTQKTRSTASSTAPVL
jgi:hypothetical protein